MSGHRAWWWRGGLLLVVPLLLWIVHQRFPLIPNPYFGTQLKWQESVPVSSGKSLRVGRDVNYSVECPLGDSPCSGRKWKWSRLRSLDAPAFFPEWDAPLIPMILDVDDDGTPWMVAASDDVVIYGQNGAPSPPYWPFTVRSGRWVLAPLPARFLGRRANLLVDFRDDDSNRLLALELPGRKGRPQGQAVFEGLQQVLSGWPGTAFSPAAVEASSSLNQLRKFKE